MLGAGTMGAQIAAHLANAPGVRTSSTSSPPARPVPAGALASGAMQVMARAEPAPFMEPSFAARVTVGNFDDDLEAAVGASDLVIEAVVERLDIKQALFARVAAAAPAHAILASNTSGIAIGSIAADLPEDARRRVVGMHFFNPPRYMHLLEVVPAATTAPEVVAELAEFSDRVLGKGVVICRDTPNFIGNRIGTGEDAPDLRRHRGQRLHRRGGRPPQRPPGQVAPHHGHRLHADLVGVDVIGHVIRSLAMRALRRPQVRPYQTSSTTAWSYH
ncbi:MAG: 3-hydroxyacyl-CoA dehydrogenase family protein [Nannocystaceae bacterium]